jgi:hypothetical protein
VALRDIIISGVAIADSVTQSLQADILLYRHSDATVDDSGKVTWGTPVRMKAVVEHNKVQARDKEGRDVTSSTQLTFPRPTLISVLDRVVLPDGTSGSPLQRAGSVVDPVTNAEYIKEVAIS